MPITLTDAAAQRVSGYLAKQDGMLGLRLGVRKTGCSGFAYQIEYAKEITESDITFQDHGITLVVGEDALPLLQGMQVDFVKQGLNETFKFRNPNVKDECGCGESFTV
ncbi:MAG: iron-sulfur cluster assembly accessory protein [Gammaproteobacteria bacterium]|jgi:iron-sulfur cluster assembly protein|nr:iron-sulfur cluster assembly accessory protein [Gammaproteobacteria bacterium]